MYRVTALAMFDALMIVLAINPSTTFVEPTSTILHVSVAATNTVAISRLIGATFPAAYLTFTLCVFVEAVQVLSPGRTASWEDVLADGAGIATGIAILALLRLSRALAQQPAGRPENKAPFASREL